MDRPDLERVVITREVGDAIQAHATEARPEECCGLLAGNGEVISSAYRLRNEADRPETRYSASPEDLFAAMKAMRQEGLEMMGIYHSHPNSSAYPSRSDVELAFYASCVYFIASLARDFELCAFRISNGIVSAVDISIDESNTPPIERCEVSE
jgi:proteasome lid subunit RPN8/RPN11